MQKTPHKTGPTNEGEMTQERFNRERYDTDQTIWEEVVKPHNSN